MLKAALRFLAAVALTVPTVTAVAVPMATNVDGTFSLTTNANIFNATTVSHTTVTGSLLAGSVAWYSFTGAAGATVYFDHDEGPAGTAALGDSAVFLFRSSGEFIAYGDDSNPVDPGTTVVLDAFLGSFLLPAADTYYLAVTSYPNFTDFSGCSNGVELQRPDGGSGGTSYSGCTARTFGFSGGGSPGTFTVHISNSAPASPPAGVPEPGTLALLGLGLAGLAALRRRKQ